MAAHEQEVDVSFALDFECYLPKVEISGSFSPTPIPLHVTACAKKQLRLQNIEHQFSYLINDKEYLDPTAKTVIRDRREVHVTTVHNIQPLGEIKDMKQWEGPALQLREIIAEVQRCVLSQYPFNQVVFDTMQIGTLAEISRGFQFGGDCVHLSAKMYTRLRAKQIPAYLIPCKTMGANTYDHVAIIVPFCHEKVEKGFALVDVGLHLPVPILYREPLQAPGSSNTPLFDAIKLRNVWYELECHSDAKEFKLHSGDLPKKKTVEKTSTYYFLEVSQEVLQQLCQPVKLRKRRIVFYDTLGEKLQELNFEINKDNFVLKWNQKNYYFSHQGEWNGSEDEAKEFFDNFNFSKGFKQYLKQSLEKWSINHQTIN